MEVCKHKLYARRVEKIKAKTSDLHFLLIMFVQKKEKPKESKIKN